jgi:hypothetical protein
MIQSRSSQRSGSPMKHLHSVMSNSHLWMCQSTPSSIDTWWLMRSGVHSEARSHQAFLGQATFSENGEEEAHTRIYFSRLGGRNCRKNEATITRWSGGVRSEVFRYVLVCVTTIINPRSRKKR